MAMADDEERGALDMHYTSVSNILKVLNPLFLDDLRAHLAEAGNNKRKLLNLRKRMARGRKAAALIEAVRKNNGLSDWALRYQRSHRAKTEPY